MDQLRASDAEREAAVRALRTAAEEGRLDTDELEERVAAAYAAKTRGELTALMQDLPSGRALSVPPPSQLPHTPGLIARWHAPLPLDQATADLMRFVGPPLHAYGYRLVSSSRTQLQFERTHRPTWTVIVAVVLFPLGLLALLHTERDVITLSATDHGASTTIVAAGNAPPGLRHALSGLSR